MARTETFQGFVERYSGRKPDDLIVRQAQTAREHRGKIVREHNRRFLNQDPFSMLNSELVALSAKYDPEGREGAISKTVNEGCESASAVCSRLHEQVAAEFTVARSKNQSITDPDAFAKRQAVDHNPGEFGLFTGLSHADGESFVTDFLVHLGFIAEGTKLSDLRGAKEIYVGEQGGQAGTYTFNDHDPGSPLYLVLYEDCSTTFLRRREPKYSLRVGIKRAGIEKVVGLVPKTRMTAGSAPKVARA